MANVQYLFRIDDICPTMDWSKFERLKAILDTHRLKALLGVIPDNRDKKLHSQPARADFWASIKKLADDGWIIAQHGFQHIYVNEQAGLIGLNPRSEFAGLPYAEQQQKLSEGKKIFAQNGLSPEWWIAPAHSFDQNTCRALASLNFTRISDGIALFPFKKYGLAWYPQQLWKPLKKHQGFWTICLHPELLDDKMLDKIDRFCRAAHDQIVDPRALSADIPGQPFWPAKFADILFKAIWYLKVVLAYRLIRRFYAQN